MKDQFDAGIIEKVQSESIYLDPNNFFLARNAVFKDHDFSTKCRVVFLSNLCDESNGQKLSHNQVCLPGQQLNNKLHTTALLYRFNRYLLVYDLEKGFVHLCLGDEDTSKLNFLWFKD